MPMNRVQFQPGLSLHEFMQRYGTQDQCEAAVISWRWPNGYVCPSCGQAGGSFSSFRRGQLLYRQCSTCHFQCSVIAGTIFEATKLPLTVWFLAMHLLTQAKTNMSMLELSRHLGVSYPSAWLMKHKLMEVMRLREASRQLSGRVELDDGYLGGERSGGKTGRGSENKVPFVTAVQTTESGEAQLVCLAQVPFTKAAVQAFVNKCLVRPLTVVSDGLSAFTVTASAGVTRPCRCQCWQRQCSLRTLQRRQHRPEQPEDGHLRCLPLDQVRQVRPPLPRRVPVPLQPPLQLAGYLQPPGFRSVPLGASQPPGHTGR
jgi:transposase-like protein